MNAVDLHYSDSETAYNMAARYNGGALTCVLKDGDKTRGEREKRLKAGRIPRGRPKAR